RLGQLAVSRLELVQRLRQVLLELADPRTFVLPRLAGDRWLGSGLRLHGLRTPTHRPLLDRSGVLRPRDDWRQATPRVPSRASEMPGIVRIPAISLGLLARLTPDHAVVTPSG